MSLYKSIKNLKTDKRLYSLNVKMGEIDPKNHQDYLQTLEDVAAKSKQLVVDGSEVETDEQDSEVN